MNFQRVPVAASGPLVFHCYKCGERIHQADEAVYADLDGPAFKAYYDVRCMQELRDGGTTT